MQIFNVKAWSHLQQLFLKRKNTKQAKNPTTSGG